ncbi:MAG: rod shape-determining protein MreC [Oscillospiraceae bacterium]|nr:rod shape-determining protein MreC [Oscillospiraceae bacterium]
MRHYFSTRVRIVLVVAVLLAVGLAVISNLTGLNLPDMVVQGVLTPLRTGVSKLTDQAEQLYSYMFRYEALAAENAALKEKLAQMEDDARLADSVSRENDRLRDLLDLKDAHEDYELVDAYIIAWGSTDWTSTLTINRGRNAGIEEGMCAITANGEVVGLVTQVGSNYAVVKTVLDSSLGISATMASSGYNGMVQGNYSTGGRRGLLRMNYLPSSAVIRNNDQVFTSGSTVYPRDLILGYVVDAGFDDTGVAKFALLEPAADIDTLEQVFILTAYNAG